MIEYEKNYEVLQNPEEELLFGLKARKREPLSPRIAYADGEHAILYRNEDEAILLDFLPSLARKTIKKLDWVLVAEFDEKKEFVREYKATVHHLPNLPLCVK